jgi:hypothetical protein
MYPFTEGQDDADIAIEEAIDELLEKLRDRTVLGNVVDWIEPAPSVWGYQDRPNGTTRIGEIKLKATKIVEP